MVERLKKFANDSTKITCPSGKEGCSRKAEYYLMRRAYDVLVNNCTVFVKRGLSTEYGRKMGIDKIGNLPSNLADWSYNRLSNSSDSKNHVTRSSIIIYYDYNSNNKRKVSIKIQGKTVKDVYLEIQKLR